MRPERPAPDHRITIRLAHPGDLGTMRDVERAAGRLFREIGMPEIADDEPLPVDVLDRYRRAALAWVAVDGTDRPRAYLVAEPVDGNLHVEQVSVHPSAARLGIGRRLLDTVAERARADGAPALTVTTFASVPWNAPYYVRCGFRVLAEHEVTEGLRSIRSREAAHGLDRWARVCMRRDLT